MIELACSTTFPTILETLKVATTYLENRDMISAIPTNQVNALQNPITAFSSSFSSSYDQVTCLIIIVSKTYYYVKTQEFLSRPTYSIKYKV